MATGRWPTEVLDRPRGERALIYAFAAGARHKQRKRTVQEGHQDLLDFFKGLKGK